MSATPITYLQQQSWRGYLRRMALLGLLALLLAALVQPPDLRAQLRRAVYELLLLSIGAKEAADMPANWQRTRASWRATGSVFRAACELVAAEFRGWALTLLRMLWAGVHRPTVAAPPPNSLRLGYLKRSSYSMLLPLTLMSSLMELPVTHLVLHSSGLTEAAKFNLHTALLLASALGVLALAGDRRLMGQAVHWLTDHQLVLSLGARAQGCIPLGDIARAKVVANLTKSERRMADAVIAPADPPNVRLVLRAGSQTDLRWLGVAVPHARTVLLYVDDPQALVSRLQTAAGQP